MALSVGTPIKRIDLGQAWLVIFPITLSGNYATPGEALASKFSGFEFKSTGIPLYLTATGSAGYVYSWALASNKLQVFTCDADAQDALVELSDGAYPAACSGDTITAVGYFEKK